MSDADAVVERTVLRLIKRHSLRAVCDYGCGDGDLLKRIDGKTGQRLRLTGIDYFSMAKRWRKEWTLPAKSPAGNMVFVDRESKALQQLSGRNGAFDLVTSVCALHHFRYPCAELQSIQSLTKPGGFVLIADWNFEGATPAGITKNLFSFQSESFHAFAGKYHRHHYTREQALDLFRATGLRIIKSESIRFNTSVAAREDASISAQHSLERMKKANTRKANTIIKDYFFKEFGIIESLVIKHGIDYPSLFVIIAQKSNRNET